MGRFGTAGPVCVSNAGVWTPEATRVSGASQAEAALVQE